MGEAAQCSICSATVVPRFSLPVLHGRHTARYMECRGCGSLQVADPYWLEEAYAGDPTGRADDPDTGRFRRNFSVARYVLALVDALVIPSPPIFLVSARERDFSRRCSWPPVSTPGRAIRMWTTPSWLPGAPFPGTTPSASPNATASRRLRCSSICPTRSRWAGDCGRTCAPGDASWCPRRSTDPRSTARIGRISRRSGASTSRSGRTTPSLPMHGHSTTGRSVTSRAGRGS